MHVKRSIIALFTVFGLSHGSLAHSSWWESGMDLLKDIQSESPASDSSVQPSNNLSSEELNKAFKEALSLGSKAVVSQLSVKDGFNADQAIHIPLPDELKRVKSLLGNVGMGHLMEDLELKLNRAAEAATPEAQALFLNAIKSMTFEDVQTIYQGPKDSGTQYLKSKTSDDLKQKMRPIIEQTLNRVGAVNTYDKVMHEYKSLPFVPDVKADLLNHVTQKGMDGMFYYLAKEEEKIRKDPVKQTTELLKKVFGSE
ncbi:MAG: DUF4197 domain-containing protein [Thiomicrorhabdus chilensis]|uniref:DUF4197 domain-containing protein n=1 Tax=Thiomicrorhabdus chilensis TaxID=63656 RepID=UPI00299EC1C5|nr:DUF4197 domain-containing protein [Thiomicrorhabdus chilensis]MDX1348032.1 DUF4197 domain-containing protein [Thiomicrorhabdus chilensis]